MSEMQDPGGQRQVGRLLSLLGDLLRETGQLLGQESAGALKAGGPRPESPAAGAGTEPASAIAGVDAAAAAGAEQPAIPAGARPAVTTAESQAEPADPLYMVLEGSDGPVAFPWQWVAETRLGEEGAPLGIRVTDASQSRDLALGRVIGLMTWTDLAARVGSVRQFFSPGELVDRLAVAGESSVPVGAPLPPAPPAGGSGPESVERQEVVSGRPASAEAPEALPSSGPAASATRWFDPFPDVLPASDPERSPAPPAPLAPAMPEQVCIISPSALARRFLMRHLCELGYEVLEARDLDDPLLPADLKGVAALFLDESLQDDWASRPAAGGGLPLVLLTVDGELSVPRNGDHPPRKAVLPRPFERAEVERVVLWLRSLATGGADRGSGDHGSTQDDTWLFADPFGPAGAREHSRR